MNTTLITLAVAALAALSLAACLSSDAVTDKLLAPAGSDRPDSIQRASTGDPQIWPLGIAP
jgi:hypothetical protein